MQHSAQQVIAGGRGTTCYFQGGRLSAAAGIALSSRPRGIGGNALISYNSSNRRKLQGVYRVYVKDLYARGTRA